jgi:hypothetical protein
MPRIVVSLSSAYPLAIEGEITLSITPDTVSPEAEVNQADANVRFLNGQRKATFSLAPGALRTEIPIASSGTVASTISVAITRLTAAGADLLLLPPALRFRVERLAPVITDACYAPTSTGLMLQVTGYSTTRELAAAEVNVGQGAPVSVNVNAITTDYYLNEVSVRTGGAFTIEFLVSLSAAGSSVSVRLRNSAGASASRPARRCN